MKQRRIQTPRVKEWVGGLVGSAPLAGDAESASQRVEMFIWQIPQGNVVGVLVAEPGDLTKQIIEHFHKTTRSPLAGPPHVPSRIRVASAELAKRLQSGLGPTIQVVCAPTPELAELSGRLEDALARGGDDNAEEGGDEGGGGGRGYLVDGVSAEQVGGFFHAAAEVFRAAPWAVLPAGATLSVTLPNSGQQEMVLTVVGQKKSAFAMILFPTWDQYELFLDAAELAAEGGCPTLPEHCALDFDPASELTNKQRQEIAAHGWEIANSKAYPGLQLADIKGAPRRARPADYVLFEVVALALAQWVRSEPALKTLWTADNGATLATKMTVVTHSGSVPVHWAAPHPDAQSEGTD